MTAWDALARLDVVTRPIDRWPGARTPPEDVKHSPFGASLATTIDELRRELEALDASNVVLGLSIRDNQIRNDGLPYASAKLDDGAVLLAFDSTHGALRYACDLFRANYWRATGADWEHNLRAIVLGLEALRRVDRYGIARDGQQYRGYAALPAPIAAGGPTHMTTDVAQQVLQDVAQFEVDDLAGEPLRMLVQRARAAAHPDRHDGDRTLWDQVEAATTVVSR